MPVSAATADADRRCLATVYAARMKTLIWLALGLLPASAWAEDMLIYRCTSSSDVPTLQRTPCPQGSRQQIQRVPDPASAAVPGSSTGTAPHDAVQSAVPPSPAASTPPRAGEERTIMEARMVEREGGDSILDSALLPHRGAAAEDPDAAAKPPPPPIFQCITAQGSPYLHEYEASPAHCELMNVQGLGGGVTPVNAASCEVVRDTCEEIAEAQRCGSWQQRFRDARGRVRFASAENELAAQQERERLRSVLEASRCAVPE